MATEKNITMREFNGTDYDTLYPKTIASQIPDVYSKTEILTTETLTKYGLTADKLPNDVFQQIKTLIDNTQQSVESKAKIQTGSYVGTGTSGSSNPCSLTFDFVPLLVVVQTKEYSAGNSTSATLVIVPQSECAWAFGNFYNKVEYNTISLSGNTLSWYNESSEFNQLNIKGRMYCYTAIG